MAQKTNKKNISYDKYFNDGYPFDVGKRYVYFSSLKDAKSPKGIISYRAAKQYLDSNSLAIQYNDNNKGTKMTAALNYLKSVADNERRKEQKLLDLFYKKIPPDLKNQFTKYNGEFGFIIQINTMIKNITNFKKQIEQELRRNEERETLDQKMAELLTKNSDPAQINKIKKMRYTYAKEAPLFFGAGDDGNNNRKKHADKALNSIFENKSNISVLTNIIIKQYGPELFSLGRTIELKPSEMNALLKVLVDKANELFILSLGKDERYGRKTNLEDFNKKACEIIRNNEFKNYINSLLNNKGLPSALSSIAEQMGMKDVIAENKNINNKIKKIVQELKEIYNENPSNDPKDFDKWRESIGADDKTLADMYQSAQLVQVQSYYASEQRPFLELLAENFAGKLGGQKNPTDDFLVGKLYFDIVSNENINEIVRDAESKLNKSRDEMFDKINRTTDIKSYQKNISLLREYRQQEKEILQKAISDINNINDSLNFILNHVILHGSVKGYLSLGADFNRRSGFAGASFGTNVFDQLQILQETMGDILSNEDLNWLLFAMLNAGKKAIGSDNKTSLEDYFSTMVGYLMFNDAQLMVEDAINQTSEQIEYGLEVHLYNLNGVYIPNSFILQKTYEALSRATVDIQASAKMGMKASLHTYNDGPINEDRHLTLQDWEDTSNAALSVTRLDMHFLAGFLDLLEQISNIISKSGLI